MTSLPSSLALLSLLLAAVIVSSFSIDDDYMTYAKRARGGVLDAKNFRLGFGKRSLPRPALAGGLDRMAFGGMKFGKRSAPASAPIEDDNVDEEIFEEGMGKRMDKAAFRVGFGRR